MEQSTLSIRINSSDKINFEKFCSETGMNVSVAINMFIKAREVMSFENMVNNFPEEINEQIEKIKKVL